MRVPWRKEAKYEPLTDAKVEEMWLPGRVMNAFHWDVQEGRTLPQDIRGFLYGHVAQGPEQERRALYQIESSEDIKKQLARWRCYGRWWSDPDGASADLKQWVAGASGAVEPPCERIRELARGRAPDDAAVLVAEELRLPMREMDGAWVIDKARARDLIERGWRQECSYVQAMEEWDREYREGQDDFERRWQGPVAGHESGEEGYGGPHI